MHFNLPQYLIESSFCLAVFYIFYHLLLRKDTHFQLNRIYLIITALFALSIPLLHISLASPAGVVNQYDYTFIPVLEYIHLSQNQIYEAVESPSRFIISVGDLIRILYGIGVLLMAYRLVDSLTSIWRLIRAGQKQKLDHSTVVTGLKDIPASSFFGYIFWNQRDDEQSEVRKAIFQHELVHVRQWHSLDVIIMEMMVIVKWFNPLIYLFRRHLRLTHEYIADAYVSGQLGSRQSYATLLLSHCTSMPSSTLTHTFYSSIKERVLMLSTSNSKWVSKLKLLLVFPITVALALLFAFDLSEEISIYQQGIDHINQGYDKISDTEVVAFEEDYYQQDIRFTWGDIDRIVTLNEKRNGQLTLHRSKLSSLQLSPDIDASNKPSLSSYHVETLNRDGYTKFYSSQEWEKYLLEAKYPIESFDHFNVFLSFSDAKPMTIRVNISDDAQDMYKSLSVFRWGKIILGLNLSPDSDKAVKPADLSHKEFLYSVKEKPRFYGQHQHIKDFQISLNVPTEDGRKSYELDITGDDFIGPNIESLDTGNIYINVLMESKTSKFEQYISFKLVESYNNLDHIRSLAFDPEYYKFLTSNSIKISDQILEGERFPFATHNFISKEKLANTLFQNNWSFDFEGSGWLPYSHKEYNISLKLRRSYRLETLNPDEKAYDIPKEIVISDDVFGLSKIEVEQLNYIPGNKKSKKVLRSWIESMEDEDRLQLSIVPIKNDDIDSLQKESFYYTFNIGKQKDSPFRRTDKSPYGRKGKSNYQIIYRKAEKGLVKLDTSLATNHKTLEVFSQSNNYEILHIPDFTTEYRVIDMSDTYRKIAASYISDPIIEELDILYLEEYDKIRLKTEEEEEFTFQWGSMIYIENGASYSRKEFLRSSKVNPKLIGDERSLQIVRTDIKITYPDDTTEMIRCDRLNYKSLNDKLKETPEGTSFEFDNIIVDDFGVWKHFLGRYKIQYE